MDNSTHLKLTSESAEMEADLKNEDTVISSKLGPFDKKYRKYYPYKKLVDWRKIKNKINLYYVDVFIKRFDVYYFI